MKIFSKCIQIVLLLLSVNSYAQNQNILLKAGKMYDSEKNIFLLNQQILIIGNKVAKVGTNLKVPAATTVIELKNATVTPGLIDAHSHLLLDMDQSKTGMEEASDKPASVRIQEGIQFGAEILKAGFTTVRDLGNSGQYLDLQLKQIFEKEKPGPRMFVSGPIISPKGGQFNKLPEKYTHLINQEYRVIYGAEDATKAVLEHRVKQVDVIKICVNTDSQKLTWEELVAVVKTAHQNGLTVTAHATDPTSVHHAALAGVDGIEHGYAIGDSTLALMAKKRIYLVPTDLSKERALVMVKGVGLSEDYAKEALDGFHKRLSKAYQNGVTIVCGSDFYNKIKEYSRASGTRDVLIGYLEAGLPVNEILKSATWNAALVLKKKENLASLSKMPMRI
ncbi:amidohydrolase family protein [Xanthocytophaga flava]|uniref:amidohydrolase family protein n=1 Tax=Xanthocytophaga flava TaxID=3048013 RepID=UPI0028D393AE|nr:amidohydrolase family protein [Xanthocytophaga flavus]MDJ1472389.1 amidohydrolase family protein [Xanthocytophaga flavus]